MAILVGSSRIVLPTKSRKLFTVVVMRAMYHASTDAYMGTRTTVDKAFVSLDAAYHYCYEQNEAYADDETGWFIQMPNGSIRGDFELNVTYTPTSPINKDWTEVPF